MITKITKEWKPIKGFERYEVSSNGRIRFSKTKNERRLSKSLCGYPMIFFRILGSVQKKGFTVHRLVAEAFLLNPHNYPQVNHKDGNKENNNVENLEWVTPSDNIKHKINVLGIGKGETHPRALLSEEQVKNIKNSNKKISELVTEFGCSYGAIQSIRNGKKLETY